MCKLEKPLEDFYRDNRLNNGKRSRCKPCTTKATLEYRKKYYRANKERLQEYKKINRARLREANRKYEAHKTATDINHKLAKSLRCRLSHAITREQKSGSAIRDLGCTIERFKEYIESKFQPEMTWENYGQWHLDHIIPLSSFNLTDREQFLKACHYTNIQPLWARDNRIKSNRS